MSGDVLPDLLRPGLRLVFCGTAAGRASARAGAYYAGPGNSFWPTLAYVGLTPRELVPSEFELLPDYGIGLTDLCKIRHGSDAEVGTVEFDVDGLHAKVAAAEPERPVAYGVQDETFGGAEVWVLPSTSGAARGHWDVAPWEELAQAVLDG